MKYTGTYPSIEKTIDNAKKIGDKANELAYSTNTKKANYPEGKPTDAFTKAKNEVYKDFKFWNAWSKAGASCDVFTGTCVRSSGVDKDFPAGLWKQKAYMDKNFTKTNKVMKDGDIILYRKNKVGVHGHICIYYKGKIKEASAKHFYGKTTDTASNRLSTAGKKYVNVYRAKASKILVPLKKGSEGEDVKRLQEYLNWYFAKEIKAHKVRALKIDGIFGKVTDNRVKRMQKAMKIKEDGVVGKITLNKMKAVDK